MISPRWRGVKSLLSEPWRLAPLYRPASLFFAGAFSLDPRGWKAAPTEKNANLLGKKVTIPAFHK
jgi:hypothetical protein